MKTVYNELLIKVNTIDTKIPNTSELATKAQYNSEKKGLE